MIHKMRRGIGFTLLIFVFAMFLPVHIWAAVNSSIPADTGTLTIHKYALADTTLAGSPNTGEADGEIPENALRVFGATFTVWQVDTTGGYSPISAEDAARHIMPQTAKTLSTTNDGTAVFTLPKGVYYVEETGNIGQFIQADGTVSDTRVTFAPCRPFLVSVPMTNPTGDGWITNVHVYPKNQSLMIDKFVNDPGGADYDVDNILAAKIRPVAAYEAFGATIVSTIPDDFGSVPQAQYTVTDIIPDYATVDMGSLQAFVAPSAASSCVGRTPLVAGTHYTAALEPATNSLTILLNAENYPNLDTNVYGAGNHYLIIKYNVSLSEAAPCGLDLTAKASLSYKVPLSGSFAAQGRHDAPLQEDASVPVAWEPSVNTGQIRVTKVSAAQESQKLSGAVFGVAASKADALAQKFIRTGTTAADGTLTFKGLSYGVPGDAANENSTNTTYWLAEVTPPEGYLPLTAPAEVAFNYQKSAETGEYYFAQLTVYNQPIVASSPTSPANPSFSSPLTGDSNLIYIGLGLLVVSLVFGYITFRTKKNKF